MRSSVAAVLCMTAGLAAAQQPDVRIRLDATISYRSENGSPSDFHAYSAFGRYSTVGLNLLLEPGLRVNVTEKLGRIPGDADTDLFDVYYVEDEGNWRIGKQVLPFGEGLLIRESVDAVRVDSGLILEAIPVSIAACDGGPGRQRGVVGRFGSLIGVSFFEGRHFAIAATSLDQIHEPEMSLGLNRGYRQAFAVGFTRRLASLNVTSELVSLSQGETDLDKNLNILDTLVSYEPRRSKLNVYLGFSVKTPDVERIIRFGGSLKLTRNISLEPMIRARDGRFWDFTAQTRLKF